MSLLARPPAFDPMIDTDGLRASCRSPAGSRDVRRQWAWMRRALLDALSTAGRSSSIRWWAESPEQAQRPPRRRFSPNISDPASFFDVEPPEEPMAVDPQFAGADSTDINPDFSNKMVLAKFYKVGPRDGPGYLQDAYATRNLEDYAKILLRTDFPPALRKQILAVHEGRNRPAQPSGPKYSARRSTRASSHAITNMKGLTRSDARAPA